MNYLIITVTLLSIAGTMLTSGLISALIALVGFMSLLIIFMWPNSTAS